MSTATVSRVLHNNGYVSAESRQRVEEALRESGYRLNVVAQELRRRKTMSLGLILHGAMSNPFVAQVAFGAAQAAAEQGFNVLFFNARGDAEREHESVEALLRRRVDGVVFTTAVSRANVELALEAGITAVEIERRLCPGAASVVVDNYAGATEATEHLIGLGHRRIGYIGEPIAGTAPADDAQSVVRERFTAYRDALQRAGQPPEDSWIVAGPYPREQGGWGGVETGASYMERLLRQAPGLTAVVAASDMLAAGALQSLYREGRRVPDELSIVGFDDTFAKHLAPALTTVRQPMFEMGFKAISLAIGFIDGGRHSAVAEHCATELIVRSSTAPPP
ncbi:LacI family transcriptional regulator [Actinomadura viridis]|uniref:LacI family transcriptional regulator n=1 Tax=Actinomadura viridis TaxID=58110 RepID=A0A931DD19_9ACTN|nr:LacI family transcriptional regulator [Actinomadura viridis]